MKIDASLISLEPFIREFTFAMIKYVGREEFTRIEKGTLHADLVPKVSDVVMQESLGIKTQNINSDVEKLSLKNNLNQMQELISPILKIKNTKQISRQKIPLKKLQRKIPQLPAQPFIVPEQKYGKISQLLKDPSVSSIECSGEGKPISVIRMGQKQITHIILTKKEIKEILEKISNEAHLPLLEGVFRAAVDDFSINAIVSEIIGSKFIIKKQILNS